MRAKRHGNGDFLSEIGYLDLLAQSCILECTGLRFVCPMTDKAALVVLPAEVADGTK
jgi:hypothetical protein